jgi:amino acid adenylation domain-containing protein
MMVEELIAKLRREDILLSAEHGELVVQARPGRLTPDLTDVLRHRKAEILAALEADGPVRYPASDIQRAYAVGRSLTANIGNVGCHFYHEFDGGPWDIARLSRAWNALVRRHVCLRAVLAPDLSAMLVEQRADYAIAVTDVGDSDAATAEARLAKIRAEMSHRLYDPGSWPLFDIRITLLPCGQTRLHLSIDLIAVDAGGIVQLLREWERLYRGVELPRVRAGFDDYARRAAELETSQQFAEAQRYWQERIAAGLPPPPNLPLACSPAQLKRPRFHRRQGRLAEPLWSTLKRRAGEAGLTPSAFLCACFAEILHCWTQQDAFTLTLTLFNRLPLIPDVEAMVGEFTSTLLLAVSPPAEGPFRTRALVLQNQLRTDLRHRLFSGVRVSRDLQKRDPAQHAGMPIVFTSLLAQQRQAGDDDLGTGWLGTCVYSISQTPQVWLDHQVIEEHGALLFNWDAVEELLPSGLLDAMFAAFTDLVTGLATDAAGFDAERPMLIPQDQRERRASYNATERPPNDATLHEAFAAQARRTPDEVAVVTPHESLSYATVHRRANAIAARLQDLGVGEGQLVAVAMAKGWEQVVGALGVLFSGAAFLPIDVTLPNARIAAILADARSRVALIQSPTMTPLALPSGITALVVDEDCGEAPRPPPIAVRPDELAYVIYTSGSTGMPKGVMIAHGAALNTIDDINRRFAVGPRDRVFGLSNLSFDLAIYDIFGPLTVGGALVLPNPERLRDPADWLALLDRHSVTVWNSVPLLMQMLVEHCGNRGARLPNALRLVLLSGDWIPLDLPDAVCGLAAEAKVVSLGGATEASIWSILFPIERVEPGWRSIPYGYPMANQSIHILDRHLEPCPDWVEGDLYIGGAGLADGYWGDAEKTARQFPIHPRNGQRLYRTGDRGRFLPQGYVEFLGRQDFQIKIRGHRVELGEIEAVLRQHPLVSDAVVVAKAQPARNTLVGYVVARTEAAGDLAPAPWHAGPLISTQTRRKHRDIGPAVTTFSDVMDTLERDSTNAMAAALRQLGMFTAAGENRTAADIITRCGLRPEFLPLLRRWLRALAETGLLATDDGERYTCAVPLPSPASIGQVLPGSGDDPLLDYIGTCWQNLPALLRGDINPLGFLFPQGDWHIAEALYQSNPVAALVNRQAARILTELVESARGPIRVLEIGAGIGSLTASLLPLLPQDRAQYDFTDVTPFFHVGARRKFAAWSFLRFAVFDALRDPLGQGLVPYKYDLLIASNVMHNAQDPALALAQLRPLLAPGGVLLLIEATRNTRTHAVSVGFIEGLSQTTREDGPFLSLPRWIATVGQAGFIEVDTDREPDDGASDIGLDLIVARAPRPAPDDIAAAFGKARAGLSAEVLRDHLAGRLPAFMIPADIATLDRFPLSANGKLDRAALPAPAMRAGTILPVTAAEVAVIAAWRDVLNREDIGPHDNFFELGGDSLLIVQLQQVLAQRFGREIAIVELFAHPTVAATAAYLAGDRETITTLPKVEDRVAQRLAARRSRHDRRAPAP